MNWKVAWPFIFGLLAVPFAFKTKVESVFVQTSYYFMLGIFIWWLCALYKYTSKNFNLIKNLKKRIVGLSLLSLLFAGMGFWSNEITFKTNSDETNLLSISQSMFFSKQTYNETMAKYYYGNYQPFNKEVPKRPLMFPFLTSMVHQIIGYKYYSPFVLNFLAFWCLLFLVAFVAFEYFGIIGSISALLLVFSHSVFPIFATSGGFDVISCTFFVICMLLTWSYTKDHDPVVFGFLIASMAIFVNIRYESMLYAGLICVYLLVTRHVPFMQWLKSWSMGLFVFVYQPQIWQRILSVGNYENPEDRGVFSFIALKEHLELYSKFVIQLLAPLPYNAILNLLSPLVATGLLIYFIKQKKLAENGITTLAILISGISVALYFAHHAGVYDHPAQARFFLIYCLLGVYLYFWIFKHFDFKHKKEWMLFSSLVMFLLYNPVANEGRFINKLVINRDLREIYRFVLSQPEENNLYIYDRPGQITALNRGAVNYDYAKENWESIVSDYNLGLYSNVYIIEEVDYQKEVDYTYNGSEVSVMKNVQSTDEEYIRFLRLE